MRDRGAKPRITLASTVSEYLIFIAETRRKGAFFCPVNRPADRSINRIEKLVLKHPAQQIDIFVQGRVLFAQLFNFAHRVNDCCVVAAAKFTPDFGQ